MSIDSAVIAFDKALRILFAPVRSTSRVPGDDLPEPALSHEERRRSEALMRVNHVGEVCAQGLYQGQALVCRDPGIRASLDKAAAEEVEHLAWTAGRISDLGGRVSYLNPVWFAGSVLIGVVAGRCGDAWSLGFLAETERQVGAHLDRHLRELPVEDAKSRAVVSRMRDDEIGHAEMAVSLGAKKLPSSVVRLMRATARIMTRTAYFV